MTAEQFMENFKKYSQAADYEVMRKEYVDELRKSQDPQWPDLLEVFALGYYCRILDVKLGVEPHSVVYEYYGKE